MRSILVNIHSEYLYLGLEILSNLIHLAVSEKD